MEKYQQNTTGLNQITVEEIKDLIKGQKDLPRKVLDFSSDAYSLLSIGVFIALPEDIKKSVVEVNLNHNRLIKIDNVKPFENLKKLQATFNAVIQINITIASIEYLDLSHNQIQTVPQLKALVNLKSLFLTHNAINILQGSDIEFMSRTLVLLDLSNNLIKFIDGPQIKLVIEAMKQLTFLQSVNFDINPFVMIDPSIYVYFVMHIVNLKVFNNKNTDQLRKEINSQKAQTGGLKEDHDLDELVNLHYEESFDGNEDDQNKYTKSVFELNCFIETCINEPSKCTEQLKSLQERVLQIVENSDQWQYMFLSDNQDIQTKIEIDAENFIQNCFIFCQNQQYYIKEIMEILAQLAVIPLLEFGRKCFELLVETIRSGKNMGGLAKSLLQEYSIPQIQKHTELKYVPTFVMEGILRSLQERKDSDLVPVSLVDKFQIWMEQIILYYKDKNQVIREENSVRDIVFLQLISEMAKYRKFVKAYNKKFLVDRTMVLFKYLMKTTLLNHQIAILDIIKFCALNHTETAHKILATKKQANNFVKDLEEEIRYNMFVFKKYGNTLVNPEAKENKESVQQKYSKFEALVQCYGALMSKFSYEEKKLKDDYFMNELLTMCALPAIHPALLNSLVLFATYLLNNDDIKTKAQSSECVKFIALKIQNGLPLLQYMGGDYYQQMLKHLDVPLAGISKNLSSQINPKVHELFVNIVKLIAYFSENSISDVSSISGICLEIATNLNSNNREQALFMALAVPNDDVRLAIVQCLLTIKISEIDTKELAKLVALLSSYNNLGAGKTELVISNIMMIMTKIVRSGVVLPYSKALNDFITIYSENSIIDSLNILVKNMERDLRTDDDENTEKLELSVMVVNFIKSLSVDKELRSNLKGLMQAKCLKSSLIYEEKFLDPSMVSIEIERTWIGKYCEYLILPLNGKESIYPFTKIWDRVYIRIAENLEDRPEDIPEDLSDLNGVYDSVKIISKVQKQDIDRRESQLRLWEAQEGFIYFLLIVGENCIKKFSFSANEIQTNEYKDLESQHTLLANQEAVQYLLNYVMGKNHCTQTMSLEEMFVYKFQGKLKFDKINENIYRFISDALSDFQLKHHGPQGKQKRQQKTERDVLFQTIICGIPMPCDPMRGFMRENQDFDVTKYIIQVKVVLIPLSKPIKTTSQAQKIIQNPGGEMIEPSRRVVTVCSYLRIVYALLAYAPTIALGSKVADQIAVNVELIRDLTLLCEWAGWNQGNIAAKYLKIFNYVLSSSSQCIKNEFIPAYMILSQALKEILNLIEFKLKNEDKNPLTFEDKVLIMETCEFTGKIVFNTKLIQFHKFVAQDIEEDKKITDDKDQAIYHVTKQTHEFFLSTIFPLNSFKVFISIMAWDMKTNQKLSKSLIEKPRIIEIQSLMRKWLVSLLGSYIVQCQSIRKEIISLIINVETFRKSYVRQSFIQEILDQTYKDVNQDTLLLMIVQHNLLKIDTDIKLSIHFSVKCFLQIKQSEGFIPVYLVFCHTHLLIVECDEKEDKSQDIYSTKYLSLTNFKQHVCVPFTHIDGFYYMECHQRICIVYSMKNPGPFVKDDGLQVAIIFFNKLETHDLMGEKLRNYNLKIYEDFISYTAIVNFIQKNETTLFRSWVVLDPQSPLINRFMEFVRNRVLIVNNGKQLITYKEKLSEWYFSNPKLFTVNSTLNKKLIPMNALGRKNHSCAYLFVPDKVYELSEITSIQIEQTLNPIMTLIFGKGKSVKKLKILFGCDTGRELFRFALISSVEVQLIINPQTIDTFKDSSFLY